MKLFAADPSSSASRRTAQANRARGKHAKGSAQPREARSRRRRDLGFLDAQDERDRALKEIKLLQPAAIRLLLTGYADKENAIKAINEVGLYHYLEKPWDNDALLNIF